MMERFARIMKFALIDLMKTVRRLFIFILPTMVIWNTNSIATARVYKLRLWMWVVVAFAYNGQTLRTILPRKICNKKLLRPMQCYNQ